MKPPQKLPNKVQSTSRLVSALMCWEGSVLGESMAAPGTLLPPYLAPVFFHLAALSWICVINE